MRQKVLYFISVFLLVALVSSVAFTSPVAAEDEYEPDNGKPVYLFPKMIRRILQPDLTITIIIALLL